jgi:hypothetical protein
MEGIMSNLSDEDRALRAGVRWRAGQPVVELIDEADDHPDLEEASELMINAGTITTTGGSHRVDTITLTSGVVSGELEGERITREAQEGALDDEYLAILKRYPITNMAVMRLDQHKPVIRDGRVILIARVNRDCPEDMEGLLHLAQRFRDAAGVAQRVAAWLEGKNKEDV